MQQAMECEGLEEMVPGEARRIQFDDWTTGTYLRASLHGEAPHNVMLTLRFHASGDPEPRVTVMYSFLPGRRLCFCFELRFLDGQTLFMPRWPGQLKTTCIGRRVLREEVAFATLTLEDVGPGHRCAVGPFALAETAPREPLTGPPVVDTLGQYRDKEWTGKTPSVDAMRKRLLEEADASPPELPGRWSRFGGSRDHQFGGTGFFRTEHDGKRWWLVDPEGFGFYSAGIDCVRIPGGDAVVAGTEELFPPEFRGADPSLARFRHDETRRGVASLDIAAANLYRAFGDEWRVRWSALTAGRLRRWRFNTIACWSDIDFAQGAAIPYVLFLSPFPRTERRLFRDLPDVFDPSYERSAEGYARQLEPYRDDTCLVGYFMTNEPHWGFGEHNLASEMLEDEPGTFTRRELARFAAERYDGDAGKLAAAWGLEMPAIEELVSRRFHRVAEGSTVAARDLWEFSRLIARRFAEVPAAALRRVDSRHLNMGVRYSWIGSDLVYETAHCVDVFSMNCYNMLPNTAAAEEVDRRCGKPLVFGEYHFGAVDRGPLGNGLRGVASQADRATAYRTYFEACAAHPSVVGCHWFLYNDEPTLGRFDGENWQIGFVDVCNHPYEETCAAATASHERMYDVRSGKVAAFDERAVEVARIAC